jgi:hypothetical protein
MHEAYRGLDFRTHGIGRTRIETARDGGRFCFKSPAQANGFQAKFGGERLTT